MGICKFVDSIVAAPTSRFDFYRAAQGVTLLRNGTRIGMPSLDRAMTTNPMSDGFNVGSSTYGARVLTLRVRFAAANVDTLATQMQLLNRELDRETNFLMWQPDGATKPVFFKTYRSAPVEVDMEEATTSGWEYSLDVLADPFALGLRETLGPFTVNNDPAAGSNGLFFDVSGVIGDVPAPAVFIDSTELRQTYLIASRRHGVPSDHQFSLQAESATLGLDTTNPGGGPDAAMSGTGTNNFVRTSFVTSPTTMNIRLTWDPATTHNTLAKRQALVGTYRVFVVARRSDATSVIRVQSSLTSGTLTLPLTTSRILVDLGTATYLPELSPGGVSPTAPADTGKLLQIQAVRDSGAGTLDWDYILLVPADEQMMTLASGVNYGVAHSGVIDAGIEFVYIITGAADPFSGAAGIVGNLPVAVSGSFPYLVPSQATRFYMITTDLPTPWQPTKSTSEVIAVHYWPRYLHVRPVAS